MPPLVVIFYCSFMLPHHAIGVAIDLSHFLVLLLVCHVANVVRGLSCCWFCWFIILLMLVLVHHIVGSSCC